MNPLMDRVSIYLSIHLSVCLSIYRAVFYLATFFFSIYLSICLPIRLSIDRSIYLSIYLSIYRCIDRSMYLCIYVSIYVSIYLSTYLSTYQSIYISILRIECRLRTIVYPHIIWHSRIHCQGGTSNRPFGSRPTAVPEKSKAMRKPLFTCHRHWRRLLQEPTSIHSRSDNLRFAGYQP